MPKKKPKKVEAVPKTLEAQLWEAADQMRGSVPPTDYMHVSLGLVFLRYLSVAFEAKHEELSGIKHADAEDPEEYLAESIYWVPEEARWSKLSAAARSSDIGKQLDDAMRALERENESLKGVLPKIYGKPDFSAVMLGGLIDHFSNLNLKGNPDDFDLLGRVYEFFHVSCRAPLLLVSMIQRATSMNLNDSTHYLRRVDSLSTQARSPESILSVSAPSAMCFPKILRG